jgi:hypothetical protein
MRRVLHLPYIQIGIPGLAIQMYWARLAAGNGNVLTFYDLHKLRAFGRFGEHT